MSDAETIKLLQENLQEERKNRDRYLMEWRCAEIQARDRGASFIEMKHHRDLMRSGLLEALQMWASEVGISGAGEDDNYDRLMKLALSEHGGPCMLENTLENAPTVSTDDSRK